MSEINLIYGNSHSEVWLFPYLREKNNYYPSLSYSRDLIYYFSVFWDDDIFYKY